MPTGRSVSWNKHENLALSVAYDWETRNSEKGKDRRRNELWKAITNQFKIEVIKKYPSTGFGYDPRVFAACRRQHITMMHDVRKYNFYYRTMLKKKPTGTNLWDWKEQANKLYTQATAASKSLPSTDKTRRVTFNFINVWKYKRQDLNNEPVLSSVEEVGLDTPGFATTVVSIGHRPPGRVAAKRMKKQDVGTARLLSYLDDKRTGANV